MQASSSHFIGLTCLDDIHLKRDLLLPGAANEICMNVFALVAETANCPQYLAFLFLLSNIKLLLE